MPSVALAKEGAEFTRHGLVAGRQKMSILQYKSTSEGVIIQKALVSFAVSFVEDGIVSFQEGTTKWNGRDVK